MFVTEIGFAVAFGVLLDTFTVRSLIVPAVVLDVGDRVWWPSAPAHRHPSDGERAAAEEPVGVA